MKPGLAVDAEAHRSGKPAERGNRHREGRRLAGLTSCAGGLTAMWKSAVAGKTVMVRVGGLGSELPTASLSVNEAV